MRSTISGGTDGRRGRGRRCLSLGLDLRDDVERGRFCASNPRAPAKMSTCALRRVAVGRLLPQPRLERTLIAGVVRAFALRDGEGRLGLLQRLGEVVGLHLQAASLPEEGLQEGGRDAETVGFVTNLGDLLHCALAAFAAAETASSASFPTS